MLESRPAPARIGNGARFGAPRRIQRHHAPLAGGWPPPVSTARPRSRNRRIAAYDVPRLQRRDAARRSRLVAAALRVWRYTARGAAAEARAPRRPRTATGARAPRRGAGPRTTPMTARRVLVVEDDRGIRDLLAAVLTDEGFDVRQAANGKEALAVLERWQPDAILLDLMMPVMDGWTFRREQRRRPP